MGGVVMLSSAAHQMAPKEGIQFDNLSGERGYKGWTAYGQSKIANLLFAKRVGSTASPARARPRTRCIPASSTPISAAISAFPSRFRRAASAIANALFLKTTPQGAATEKLCRRQSRRGQHHRPILGRQQRRQTPFRRRATPALAAKLWDVSEKIVAGLG